MTGKLWEKVVAEELQKLPVFYKGQYGLRKKRSAIDALMLITSKVQEALDQRDFVTLVGDDIQLTFNNTRLEGIVD